MLLDPRDVGKAIGRLRGNRTQAEVAKQAELSRSQWNVYEGGKRAPGKDALTRILKGLGCSEEELFQEVVKARTDRLGERGKTEGPGESPAAAEEESRGYETQLLLTELRSLRAQLTMLSTYFIGLDRRLEKLFGERLSS